MIHTDNSTIYPQIHLNKGSEETLFEQLVSELRRLINAGFLTPGTQLPTVRTLAAHLGIHFNTVARVYHQLDEEGWISAQQGRGTFVRETKYQKGTPLPQGTRQSAEKIAAILREEAKRLHISEKTLLAQIRLIL
jgi:GntR family transcriptional regulator